MTKLNKKDYIGIAIISLLFLIYTFILTGFDHRYGSTIDWLNQHWIIPEYLRNLFYDTRDISPDFAFNIGGGQNIYYLSYYGLFNPYILISYMLPFVDMIDYIAVCSRVIVIISIFLMCYLLRQNGFSTKISLFTTFIFATAGPLIFHSHRQLMFINYMPFLILGLIGVDLWLNKKKSYLIVISTLLIILSSYYYSIVCLIVIFCYGIYKFLKNNDKFQIKKFINYGFSLGIPMIIGVLMSGILILPTFAAILNGRDASGKLPNLTILLPKIHFSDILYNPYSIGIICFGLLAIISQLFSKKKGITLLSCVIICAWIFPVIQYILNGTLYVNSKVLIPLLPLVCLLIADFTVDLLDKNKLNIIALMVFLFIIFFGIITEKSQYKIGFILDFGLLCIYLFSFIKFKKEIILIAPVCIMCVISVITVNKCDELLSVEEANQAYSDIPKELINKVVKEDNDFYRISNQYYSHETVNKIYCMDYYDTTLYSSTYNKSYNNFCNNKINNEISYRNSVITHSTKNIIFNMLMSNKYVIASNNPQVGYELKHKIDDLSIYQNNDVLPLGFASDKLIGKSKFDSLKYPYSSDVYLSSIIVDKELPNKPKSNIQAYNLDIASMEKNNVDINKENGKYHIIAHKNAKINLKLKGSLKRQILFIRFNMEYQQPGNKDTCIIINGVKNKLSSKGGSYPNNNFVFDYVVSSNEDIESLNIIFFEGKYVISGIETYLLDYDSIKDISRNVDKFNVDKEATKGDNISGDINVTKDGYFMLTIPYDNGFEINVDNMKVSYEKVNDTFIGFPIKKGYHKIDITYHSPLKKAGVIVSIIGVLSFITLIFVEKHLNKKNMKPKLEKELVVEKAIK